jgi:hypothetical protein
MGDHSPIHILLYKLEANLGFADSSHAMQEEQLSCRGISRIRSKVVFQFFQVDLPTNEKRTRVFQLR